MFQPQPTPYAHFASYGAPTSVPEYSFQSPGFAPTLSVDSGGPIVFNNPTFSPVGNSYPNLNVNIRPQFNAMDTPPSDDMAAQEALARQYQPDLKGPLVGEKKSSHAITEEYAKADPIYVAKTSTLPQTYSHYRQILGDGNCGWRAIAFSYFETLAKLQDKEQVEEEFGRMMSLSNFITNMCGHEEWIFEDMRDETLALLRVVADAIPSKSLNDLISLILESMNDPEKSNAIVYYFRLLASAWLKAHASTYQGFIPDDGVGVDNYCKDVIEPPNTEIDHLGMTLLIDVLLKPVGFAVEIVYLDRSSGNHVNSHLHQAEDENGVPTNPTGPIIHLLYRPGHYDILYKDASTVSATMRQQVLDSATASSNIRVNRAVALDRHNPIESTALSHIDDYPVDMATMANIPGFSLAPVPGHHGFPTSFSPVGDYQPLSTPTYAMESSATVSPISPSAITPILPVPPIYPAANTTLPIHPLNTELNPAPTSQFRHSKYEYETDWNEAAAPTFQTSTFKNSHYNTAHYNNPNFQPEEWSPDCEEAVGREKRETGRHKSA